MAFYEEELISADMFTANDDDDTDDLDDIADEEEDEDDE